MNILYKILKTYFIGNNDYLDNNYYDSTYHYPNHMSGVLLLDTAYSDLLHSIIFGTFSNPVPYEVICNMEPKELSIFSIMILHMYIALMYNTPNYLEKSLTHIRIACNIAEKIHKESAIAYFVHYFPDYFVKILQSDNPTLLNRLLERSNYLHTSFHGLLNYIGKNRNTWKK